MAEDDGLEYYYKYQDEEGNTKYLLSNNVPFQDRDNLANLYHGHERQLMIHSAIGFLGGLELYRRLPNRIRNAGLAIRLFAFIGVESFSAAMFKYFVGNQYGPLLTAYFKKYDSFA